MNLTNKKGKPFFQKKVSDYVREVETILGRKVDYILCNSDTPSDKQFEMYKMVEGDGVFVLMTWLMILVQY